MFGFTPSTRYFEYQLCDAWVMPETDVCVGIFDEQIQVRFLSKDALFDLLKSKAGQRENKPVDTRVQVICIDKEVVDQIINIFRKHERIFTLEKDLPSTNKAWGFDGNIQKFYFSDDEHEVELQGNWMDYVMNHRKEFPDDNLVIYVLYQICDILVPLGVDENCFRLASHQVITYRDVS